MSEVAGQQHPIGIYLKVWLSAVRAQHLFLFGRLFPGGGLPALVLILIFMFLKAGFILAIFMHVSWERLSLKYVLFVPLIAIAVLIML